MRRSGLPFLNMLQGCEFDPSHGCFYFC